MLRAALIGFPSSGKSTLFQLMTSARDGAGGKGDVKIGISKVPDDRLDVLTGMYNPKKRVPATVEFTDIAVVAKAGAQALVDVANYKNADALVHVVRAFRDETVPHPSGSVDPARDAQAMEDELILADLGVAERRLERIERDLKKGRSAELEKERDVVQQCKYRARGRQAAAHARARRRRPEAAARLPVPVGQAAAARDQPRRGRRRRGRRRSRSRRGEDRPDRLPLARRNARGGAVRQDRARDRAARARRRQGLPRRPRAQRSRASIA